MIRAYGDMSPEEIDEFVSRPDFDEWVERMKKREAECLEALFRAGNKAIEFEERKSRLTLVKSASAAAESHGTETAPRRREVRISASLSKSSVYPKNKTVNNVERGDTDSCGTKPTRLTP